MNAVSYLRFSSENQRDSYSLESQNKAILEYCAKNNINVSKSFIDSAKSGTKVDKRDNFLLMFDYLKENRQLDIKAVIVHKLDKFARNRYDSAIYRKKLKDLGIKLISVLENLEEDNPEDVILLSVLEGMSEYYSKNLSREIKKGLHLRIDKGLHCGSPIYGYNLIKDKLVINEEQSNNVKYIFNAFLYEKKTIFKIASELNAKGFKGARGSNFCIQTLSQILKNKIYIGTRIMNKTLQNGTIETVTFKEYCTPIVSLEDFNAVQNLMKTKSIRVLDSSPYLLTGLLFYEDSNIPYTGTTIRINDVNYKYYRLPKKCNQKHILKDTIETLIYETIKDNLFDKDTIESILPRVLKQMKSISSVSAEERERLQAEVNEISKLESKTLDLYLEDKIDKPLAEERLQDYKNKKTYLNSELNKSSSFDNLNIDHLRILFNRLFRLFDIEKNDIEIRKLYKKAINKIQVYKDKIILVFNFTLGSTDSIELFSTKLLHQRENYFHAKIIHDNFKFLSVEILA